MRCGPILVFSPKSGVAVDAARLHSAALPEIEIRLPDDEPKVMSAFPDTEVLYGWDFRAGCSPGRAGSKRGA